MRLAYIVYDSDLTEKVRVQAAERGLGKALRTHGVDPRAVRLPSTPEGDKQGADDYLKVYGETKFLELAAKAKPISTDTGAKSGEPVLERFADMKVEDVKWLWTNRIACGMLNAIIGNPGEGKSTLAMEIAACGSRGLEPWSKKECEPFTTIYMSNENVHSVTSKPRFLAMGGDIDRVIALDKIEQPNGSKRPVTLDDVGSIEKAIIQTGARLVIIDPLQSYLGAKVDSNQANQTRAKLDPLVDVAKRTGAAIIIVAHTPKQSGSRAIHSMLGSVDIAGAMRSILMVGTPATSPSDRALLLVKHSVGPPAETLGFRIVSEQGLGAPTRIEWQGPVSHTFADLHAPQKSEAQSRTQKESASDWLRVALASGPRLATELYEDWAGHSGLELGANFKGRAERTLQVAAQRLNVDRNYEGGKHGKRMWSLKPQKFAGGTSRKT
jgi:hypothetical protein